MDRRHQIAKCIIPGAAFVAVERLVVFGVDLAAKLLPARDCKADLDVGRVMIERGEARARKVLALVEF